MVNWAPPHPLKVSWYWRQIRTQKENAWNVWYFLRLFQSTLRGEQLLVPNSSYYPDVCRWNASNNVIDIVTLSEIGTWRLKIDYSSAIYSCRKHVYQIRETVWRIQWDSRDVVSSLSALYGKNTRTNGCHESSMLPSEVELSFKVAKDTSVTFQSCTGITFEFSHNTQSCYTFWITFNEIKL